MSAIDWSTVPIEAVSTMLAAMPRAALAELSGKVDAERAYLFELSPTMA